jgi:serine/threonine protein phosphatase 1
MTTLVIADVHGCFTELANVIGPYFGTGYDVVFLGDLIDRSPEPQGDLNVLGLVKDIDENPGKYGFNSSTVLRGNHEVLFLDAVECMDWELWKHNGGCMQARHKIQDEFLDWMSNLPTHCVKGDFLFVHAGVRPDVPLEEQSEFDLTWIRKPFLTVKDHGLPYTIVHGHTITNSEDIEYYGGRIAMDTGSFRTGKIGNLVLDC